jgi:hypothetical protein
MFLRILVLLLWPLVVGAQVHDEILVQGVKYPLQFAPLEPYLKRLYAKHSYRQLPFTPQDREKGALLRPYVATWEIRQSALYLLSVKRLNRGPNREKWLQEVSATLFPDKSLPILASWFTGTIILDEVPPWKRASTKSIHDGVVFLGFEEGQLVKWKVQSVEEARKNP